jgi:hypothetical protein
LAFLVMAIACLQSPWATDLFVGLLALALMRVRMICHPETQVTHSIASKRRVWWIIVMEMSANSIQKVRLWECGVLLVTGCRLLAHYLSAPGFFWQQP